MFAQAIALNMFIMLKSITRGILKKINMSFKKIISNLAFSPSTVGQLGVLAKKTKNEQLTRKVGLFFLILTIFVQLVITTRPPESANSASVQDMSSRGYGDNVECFDDLDIYCQKSLDLSQTIINASQGNIPASNSTVMPGDQLSVTINITNGTNENITTRPSVRLADMLEYTSIIDKNAGYLEEDTNTLLWSKTDLVPGATQTRTFILKTLDEIPLTAHGKYYTESYDCKISSMFGNKIDANIECPLLKNIESISSQLPQLQSPIATYSLLSAFAISILLYARTRQISREIKLIRRDASAGTI